MLAEFSIYPTDETHMSRDIAQVVEILQQCNVNYRLGPMGTSLEGDAADVLQAIQRCHQAVAEKHARVVTHITLDDRRDGAHHLEEMVSRVEEQLQKPAGQ